MSHEAYACCKSSSDGRPREHTWPEQGAPSRHATPRWTPRVAGARRPGTLYNRGQCRHKDSGAYRYPDLKGAHDHDQATALCWACITKQVFTGFTLTGKCCLHQIKPTHFSWGSSLPTAESLFWLSFRLPGQRRRERKRIEGSERGVKGVKGRVKGVNESGC